jgi:hypothetical protein
MDPNKDQCLQKLDEEITRCRHNAVEEYVELSEGLI